MMDVPFSLTKTADTRKMLPVPIGRSFGAQVAPREGAERSPRGSREAGPVEFACFPYEIVLQARIVHSGFVSCAHGLCSFNFPDSKLKKIHLLES
jgi:hypothetical protein